MMKDLTDKEIKTMKTLIKCLAIAGLVLSTQLAFAQKTDDSLTASSKDPSLSAKPGNADGMEASVPEVKACFECSAKEASSVALLSEDSRCGSIPGPCILPSSTAPAYAPASPQKTEK